METLFRGKRKDGGGWVEGFWYKSSEWDYDKSVSPAIKKHYEYIIPGDLSIGLSDCEDRPSTEDYYIKGMFEVIPESVSQYIGMEDKNGKKIFNNDIVMAQKEGVLSKGKHKHQVIFYYGCFKLAMLPRKIILRNIGAPLIGNDVEIIGNTTDNPELIKEN